VLAVNVCPTAALPLMVGGAVEVGGFLPPPFDLAAPPTLGNMKITTSANATNPILSAFSHLRDAGMGVGKRGVMSGPPIWRAATPSFSSVSSDVVNL
jgi:hypothetical protein